MQINEIFCSLQGEGHHTGRAAVFVRLSGCNLRCPFCDTRHESGRSYTDAEILSAIAGYPTRHLIFTGGEPSLQLTARTVSFFRRHGYYIQVETNGTRPLPPGIDWVTCSPKFEFCPDADIRLTHIDELKVVFDGTNNLGLYDAIPATCYMLQPCDTGDALRNARIVSQTVRYILAHPRWQLSLQTHKILNIQ